MQRKLLWPVVAFGWDFSRIKNRICQIPGITRGKNEKIPGFLEFFDRDLYLSGVPKSQKKNPIYSRFNIGNLQIFKEKSSKLYRWIFKLLSFFGVFYIFRKSGKPIPSDFSMTFWKIAWDRDFFRWMEKPTENLHIVWYIWFLARLLDLIEFIIINIH